MITSERLENVLISTERLESVLIATEVITGTLRADPSKVTYGIITGKLQD